MALPIKKFLIYAGTQYGQYDPKSVKITQLRGRTHPKNCCDITTWQLAVPCVFDRLCALADFPDGSRIGDPWDGMRKHFNIKNCPSSATWQLAPNSNTNLRIVPG